MYIQAAGAIHGDFTKNFEQAEIWWSMACLHCAHLCTTKGNKISFKRVSLVQPFCLPALYSFVDNPKTWAKEYGRDASFLFIDNVSRLGELFARSYDDLLRHGSKTAFRPYSAKVGRSSQKVLG